MSEQVTQLLSEEEFESVYAIPETPLPELREDEIPYDIPPVTTAAVATTLSSAPLENKQASGELNQPSRDVSC